MHEFDEFEERTYLDKIIRLQSGLVACATGGVFEGGDAVYKRLRRELLERDDIANKLPDFLRRSRDIGQFWEFIKHELKTYAERRTFIWNGFHAALEYLETNERNPSADHIASTIENFDPDTVHSLWQKALDRRVNDPDGAVTAARSLLESTCKHILDDSDTTYPDDADLPKLWALCAEKLNLAPHQHQEKIFKAILGNCQSVVNNIASIRNKIGDAHGQGRRAVKPGVRHAELVVNLAGAMAAFLISTWQERPLSSEGRHQQ